MSFHEVQFPPEISRGSAGGPTRLTDVVTLRSGAEKRSGIWANSRRKYNAGLGIDTMDNLYTSLAFFEAREGMLYGFRWKDWADFKSCPPETTLANTDQWLGMGDGSTVAFQLQKAYVSGPTTIYRDIKKPVAGTVVVAVDGTPASFTIDNTTGIVTMDSAPAYGSDVTAGFEFDVPVRFDQDELVVSVLSFNAGEVPTLNVTELLL